LAIRSKQGVIGVVADLAGIAGLASVADLAIRSEQKVIWRSAMSGEQAA